MGSAFVAHDGPQGDTGPVGAQGSQGAQGAAGAAGPAWNIAASDTTYTSGTVVLSGGANVTVGTNGQTVTISAAGFSAGVSNLGNTAGSTGATGSRLVFAGSNWISLSQSTNSAGATVSVVPGGYLNRLMLNSAALYSSTTFAHINTSVSIMHLEVPHYVSFTRVDWPVSISLATNNANSSFAFMRVSAVYVIYTRDASTLNPIVGGSSTTTYTWQSNNQVLSSLTGPRMLSMPLATALTPGDYWMAFQLSTVSDVGTGAASTALRGTIAPIMGTSYSVLPFQDISASTAGTNHLMKPFQGANSVSISATNQTHQLTQMTHHGTAAVRANMIVILRNV